VHKKPTIYITWHSHSFTQGQQVYHKVVASNYHQAQTKYHSVITQTKHVHHIQA